MPLPVVFPLISTLATAIKLPAIAAFFGSIFAQLAGFFATRLSVNVAIQLAAISAIVGLTLALLGGIKAILYGISSFTPAEYTQAMSLIVPSNLLPCASAVLSAHVIRWVWIWQFYFIESVARSK